MEKLNKKITQLQHILSQLDGSTSEQRKEIAIINRQLAELRRRLERGRK